MENFRNVRKLKRPILVHVVTRKGKGYEPAEKEPSLFHGLGPFDIATGQPLSKGGPPTYTSVFAEALVEEAKKDEKIVGVTAAMLEGSGIKRLAVFKGRQRCDEPL